MPYLNIAFGILVILMGINYLGIIKIDVLNGYNCNSVVGTMKRKWHIKNLSGDGPGIDPGWGAEIPEEMFKRGENRYEKNFNNIN